MPARSTPLLAAALVAVAAAVPASSGTSAARPAPTMTTDAHTDVAEKRLPNGLYELRTTGGHVSTTHGHDAPLTPSTAPDFTPAEYRPACATANRTFVFYMSPSDKAYRYNGTMIARLRTYTRQVTGFIRSQGLASSNNTKGPILKVACNSDGSIRVGGLRSTTTSAKDDFATIKQDLINAGFNDPHTKYLVFYDDPSARSCGLGELDQDDRKSTANLNNHGATYAVVYGNTTSRTCWTWHTALHELFHMMGAVQDTAPYNSGSGHCNDGLDIMCYGDDGQRSNYTETRCTSVKLDCRYDTYFDTVTESGEWLATHWNIGWSGNYYLKF